MTRARDMANGDNLLPNHGKTWQIPRTVIKALAQHLVKESLTCAVTFRVENAGLGTNADSFIIPAGDVPDQARQEVIGINSI